MMQKPNTGKWRENNSAVSNSARPHPSTQPLKKPLFTHLKVFLLSWLLLFPRLQNHWHRPFRWGWRALCCMIYEPNSEVRLRVTDGQKWIRILFVFWIRSYVCLLKPQILAQERQIFPPAVMQLVGHSFFWTTLMSKYGIEVVQLSNCDPNHFTAPSWSPLGPFPMLEPF